MYGVPFQWKRLSGTDNSIDNVNTILYILLVVFEWDSKKNILNVDRHGIPFEKVQEIFEDPLHLSVLDERFTYFEERWITMGQTKNGEILVVAHLYVVDQEDEKIRIISARKATRTERKQYETIE